MLEIDGSQKSGSGTILRLSVALAGILNEPLHISKIRQRRSQPGLRPQHLEAVLTAAKICNAETRGAKLGSRELWFKPTEIVGGEVHAEIGTAGSIPMLLLTILPLCAFARKTVRVHVVKGGTDVRHAPTINYIKHVLLPMLERMGLETKLEVQKYGYYPKGMGEISLEVQPCSELKTLRLENFGNIEEVKGISVCTFLAKRKVAQRQAKAANKILKAHGYEVQIDVVNDRSNPLQKGSSLVLWTKTSTDALLGGDAIGELRKPSESVGREAAENLVKEIEAEAIVDVHLADMLVPYMALAKGESTYLCRSITEHLDTNIWLAQKILGARFEVGRVGSLYRVRKVEA
ncbi:RNA 3'-terminal phosphate cyclase [Candidatus Bathyarchaeota archaeon]|nr:RNA 3'-terminal phosphate cyclase [Candidatus Bathyarchaeota archaeon]